jgi:hypothetical protein
MIRSRVRPPPGRHFGDLQWLIDVLWQEPDVQARVVHGASETSGSTAVWAVVPNASRPRFLVPLAGRRAAIASLTTYNRLRPLRIRAGRSVVAGALRMGLGGMVARDRVEVTTGSPNQDPNPLGRVLRRTFNRDDLTVAVGVGGAGPNRKPTLQVFSRTGEPIGFAKLGWSPATRRAVRNEAEALARWNAHVPSTFAVPALVGRGQEVGLEFSLTAPLPKAVRRRRPKAPAPPATITHEVASLDGLTVEALGATEYWLGVRARAESSASGLDPSDGRGLRVAVRRLEDRSADEPMLLGAWHGDWSPWNMASLRGSLFVFDWEHWGTGVPLGFDLLHFHFQRAFNVDRRPVKEAAHHAERLGLPLLGELGLSPLQGRIALEAYLLEAFLRADERRRAGGGVSRVFYPELLAWIRAQTDR